MEGEKVSSQITTADEEVLQKSEVSPSSLQELLLTLWCNSAEVVRRLGTTAEGFHSDSELFLFLSEEICLPLRVLQVNKNWRIPTDSPVADKVISLEMIGEVEQKYSSKYFFRVESLLIKSARWKSRINSGKSLYTKVKYEFLWIKCDAKGLFIKI